MKKILYGVCGIGNGHTYRQLPLIAQFAKTSRIVIFAYDRSLTVLRKRFRGNPRVTVLEVAVPFYAGSPTGLDFAATARANAGRHKKVFRTNARAFAKAERLLGTPDLVLTDYEPVSADYAYATGAPLVTIDQQSKYLVADAPKRLAGLTYQDEVARLRLFFPKADARIACSFFRVGRRSGANEDVRIVAPVVREEIIRLRRRRKKTDRSVLIYLSTERALASPAALRRMCAAHPEVRFHVFGAGKGERGTENVTFYPHGNPRFLDILGSCVGIVSTAGHSLLSEAMFLGIPVLAVPVDTYEQHMNAHIIAKHGFGLSRAQLDARGLAAFLKGLSRFARKIHGDRRILLRTQGQKEIVAYLERRFLFRKGFARV